MVRTITMLSAFFIVLFCALPGKAEVEASFGVNFSELNDYGEWTHVEGLGRVWRPDAEEGWRPFMYGHWVYSNEGWQWDSDEPFGWIVCHYGNWYNDEEQGWVWVPGNEWSPARVEWHVTDNEIGWAPLFPPGHHQRFMQMQWMFCPTPFFASEHWRDHFELRVRPSHSDFRVHVYAGAPRFDFIRRHTHETIVRVSPHKVRVENGPHALFRVEFGQRHGPDVEIHVGPKFRRSGERVEVQERPRGPDIRREEPRQEIRTRVEPQEHRVIVEPRREVRENKPEARVRVEPKNRRGDDDNDNRDNGDDNNNGRSRARIQQRQ